MKERRLLEILKLIKDGGFIGIDVAQREEPMSRKEFLKAKESFEEAVNELLNPKPKEETPKDLEPDIYADVLEVFKKHGYDLEEFIFKKNFELETPQRELTIRVVKSL